MTKVVHGWMPYDPDLEVLGRWDRGWCSRLSVSRDHVRRQIAAVYLSQEELEIIRRVVTRAEVLERTEEQRLRSLALLREKVLSSAHGDGSTSCLFCARSFDLGQNNNRVVCYDCGKSICLNCKIDNKLCVGSEEVIYLCKSCFNRRELWMKSGAWFTNTLPAAVKGKVMNKEEEEEEEEEEEDLVANKLEEVDEEAPITSTEEAEEEAPITDTYDIPSDFQPVKLEEVFTTIEPAQKLNTPTEDTDGVPSSPPAISISKYDENVIDEYDTCIFVIGWVESKTSGSPNMVATGDGLHPPWEHIADVPLLQFPGRCNSPLKESDTSQVISIDDCHEHINAPNDRTVEMKTPGAQAQEPSPDGKVDAGLLGDGVQAIIAGGTTPSVLQHGSTHDHDQSSTVNVVQPPDTFARNTSALAKPVEEANVKED